MISFATCDLNRAVEFIQKNYPSKEVTKEKFPLLAHLIQKDILRVQDPDFHKPCQIIAGNSYSSAHDAVIESAMTEFKANVHFA